MAAAPVYFTAAKIAHCRITAGLVANDGSGASTAFTWYNTAPASDYMLTRLVASSTSATGVGDLADSLINMFLSDGTTERLVRSFDPGNPAAWTTTSVGFQREFPFGPEFILPSVVLPRVACTVTPTAGNLDFVLFAQML